METSRPVIEPTEVSAATAEGSGHIGRRSHRLGAASARPSIAAESGASSSRPWSDFKHLSFLVKYIAGLPFEHLINRKTTGTDEEFFLCTLSTDLRDCRIGIEVLKKAFDAASSLPPERRDALAKLLLAEIEDEKRWDKAFAKSQDKLADIGLLLSTGKARPERWKTYCDHKASSRSGKPLSAFLPL
ncbi:MAG: hypothetical protein ABSF90_21040 [Syntrophobacteraceae bacterium]